MKKVSKILALILCAVVCFGTLFAFGCGETERTDLPSEETSRIIHALQSQRKEAHLYSSATTMVTEGKEERVKGVARYLGVRLEIERLAPSDRKFDKTSDKAFRFVCSLNFKSDEIGVYFLDRFMYEAMDVSYNDLETITTSPHFTYSVVDHSLGEVKVMPEVNDNISAMELEAMKGVIEDYGKEAIDWFIWYLYDGAGEYYI